MFENLKQQIAQELVGNNPTIDNLDTYIYELHNVCEHFLKQVPEQSSYEFYEFAAKFLKYLLDEDYPFVTDMSDIVDVFEACPDEICEVTNALSSQSGEDITSEIIKIISSAKSFNIVNNEEEAEIFLNSIFTITLHDWKDMDDQYIHCNWNQVMLMNGLNEENIEDNELHDYVSINSYNDGIIFYDDESIKELENDGVIVDWYQGPGTYDTFNNFTPVDLVSDFPDKDYSEEDDPNFGVDALFSFLCVTGPDSADQALEIIYNECGWVGHPEDEIEAGTDFPLYDVIDQEEANWFNANMNAIFDHYDGDPNEFALCCIDPEAAEDLIYDFEPTGYKTTSNLGGREIEICLDGSMARIKFENGTISDWLEIYYTDEYNCDYEEGRAYVITKQHDDSEDYDTYWDFLDTYTKY